MLSAQTNLKLYFIPSQQNNYHPYLLRNPALLLYTLIFFFVNLLLNTVPGFVKPVSASSVTADRLIELANSERERYGLESLNTNVLLTSAAHAKANHMLQKQYWDHYAPDGTSPWVFVKSVGYDYVYSGENLAKGFKSAEGVHQAWLASPTHRANILSGNYKEIGIAVVSGNLQGEDVILVVQLFGNLTSEIDTTVVEYENKEVTNPEDGEIKSIKIHTPAKDSWITNRKQIIEGSVGKVEESYTIELFHQKSKIGDISANSSAWSFEQPYDWSEGEHELSAQLGDGSATDSVRFYVDSSPPKVIESTIELLYKDDDFYFTVLVEDENPTAMLVAGSDTYKMKLGEDGLMSVVVPSSLIGKNVNLIVSDQLGNTAESDVSEYFEKEDSTLLINSIAEGFDVKTGVNLVLISFIIMLFAFDIYYLKRHGKLALKHHSVLSIGVWCLMLVAGTFAGFEGSLR